MDGDISARHQEFMRRYIFHFPPHLLGQVSARSRGFYGTLIAGVQRAGGEVAYRERAVLRAHPSYEADAFHFVHQGLVDLPNALNTAPSYLRGFWQADPKGSLGQSSLRTLDFVADDVPRARAEAFCDWLRKRTIGQRLSKHGQPEAEASFGSGAIAVFLQGESLPVRRIAYVDEVAMVRALVAARGDRQVLIKRHPRNAGEESFSEIAALADACDGVRIVDANVHDILRSSAVCASISSSVAIEAMLHDVPSLTLGNVDFHHCTQIVSDLEDVPHALEAAMAKDWPFEAFLFWFFRHHCLDMRAQDWLGKLNKRMGAFALEGLGRG